MTSVAPLLGNSNQIVQPIVANIGSIRGFRSVEPVLNTVGEKSTVSLSDIEKKETIRSKKYKKDVSESMESKGGVQKRHEYTEKQLACAEELGVDPLECNAHGVFIARSPEVVNSILSSINISTQYYEYWANITPKILERYVISIALSNDNTIELDRNDLHGLTNLIRFSCDSDNLKSLPEDFFEKAPNLNEIQIGKTDIETLPDGIFKRNTKLKVVILSSDSSSNDHRIPIPSGTIGNIILNNGQLIFKASDSYELNVGSTKYTWGSVKNIFSYSSEFLSNLNDDFTVLSGIKNKDEKWLFYDVELDCLKNVLKEAVDGYMFCKTGSFPSEKERQKFIDELPDSVNTLMYQKIATLSEWHQELSCVEPALNTDDENKRSTNNIGYILAAVFSSILISSAVIVTGILLKWKKQKNHVLPYNPPQHRNSVSFSDTQLNLEDVINIQDSDTIAILENSDSENNPIKEEAVGATP